MSAFTYDAIGIGVAVHDVIMELDTYPPEDAKAAATSVREGAGGPVLRAGLTMCRLGRSVALIAAVGDDGSGDAIVSTLADAGIDHHLLVRTDRPTRRAHVWIAASGTRTIVHSGDDATIDVLSEPARDALAEARAVLFDGRELSLALEAARHGRAAGALLSIDLGASVKPGIDDLAAACDVVIGPARSVARAGGADDVRRAATNLLERGARLVVITAGADGAHAIDRDRYWHQPALPVDVVDSNGAGDVFHGGLVDALLNGADHTEAVRRAATAAALSIEHRGDVGLPDRATLRQALVDRWTSLN